VDAAWSRGSADDIALLIDGVPLLIEIAGNTGQGLGYGPQGAEHSESFGEIASPGNLASVVDTLWRAPRCRKPKLGVARIVAERGPSAEGGTIVVPQELNADDDPGSV
jgi:hypothetical protein